jgi:hypothetical protein
MKNLSVALLLFSSFCFATAGDITKCTDASGRTTYGDQPCSNGKPMGRDEIVPAASTNSSVAAMTAAGKIDLIEGDVHLFDRQKKPRIVHASDNIYEGDSIATGNDGEIHLTMADEGFIAVRPNTTMRITRYRAQGDDQDNAVIGLLVGSLRCITGWIGKYRPHEYKIRTPTATIGIRGTDHEPMVLPEGSTEGEPGTYDKVNFGGSYIKTAQGSVEVSPQHAAFAPVPGKQGVSRPRLLQSIPGFYRPSRNEQLIEGKHELIQRTLEKRRAERRQTIKENRLQRNNLAAAKAREQVKSPMRNTKRTHHQNKRKQMREEKQSSSEQPEQTHQERRERR